MENKSESQLTEASLFLCWIFVSVRHVQGDSIKVRMSDYPMPSINKTDETDDWFKSLVRCLRWNDRLDQRHFEEDTPKMPFVSGRVDGWM